MCGTPCCPHLPRAGLAALQGDDVIGGIAAYELPKFERLRKEIYLYHLAVASAHRRPSRCLASWACVKTCFTSTCRHSPKKPDSFSGASGGNRTHINGFGDRYTIHCATPAGQKIVFRKLESRPGTVEGEIARWLRRFFRGVRATGCVRPRSARVNCRAKARGRRGKVRRCGRGGGGGWGARRRRSCGAPGGFCPR
jgi:hypothetical protein